ncbi:MAG: CHAT domain-containing protein [Cyanobacteria bacterium J06636_16]
MKRHKVLQYLMLLVLTTLMAIAPAQAQRSNFQSEIPLVASSQGSVVELIEQGRTFYTNNQFEEAITVWQEAARIAERESEHWQQAQTLTYLSQAYQRLARWPEAMQASQTSLAILDAIQSDDAAAYARLYAQALNTQGGLAFAQGQIDLALTTWQRSTEFYEQAGDQIGVTGSLINQAQVLETMGLYRRSCNTLLEAMAIDKTCQLSEASILEEILPTFTNYPDARIKMLGLRSLGNSLRLIGAFAASEAILQTSLEVATSPQDISLVLLALADTKQGLYTQSKDLFDRTQSVREREVTQTHGQQALELYQKAADTINGVASARLLAIQAHVRQLSLLLSFKDWQTEQNSELETAGQPSLDERIQTQVRILRNSELESFPASQLTISALLDMVESWQQLGPNFFTEAVTYAEKALSDAEATDNTRARSQALGALGHLYEVREPSRSQTLTETALGLAQSIQAEDIAYRWQWQLGRLYHKQQNDEAAITAYQAAVSTLNTLRQDLLATSPEVQFTFLEEVDQVYRETTRLLLDQKGTLEQTQNHLQNALTTMDALQLARLENFLSCQLGNNQAVALTHAIAPTEVPEQGSVDSNAAVIRTILFADRLDLVLAMPEQPLRHYVVSDVSYGSVVEKLERLRAELREPGAAAEVRALSSQLYDWLMAPLIADLRQETAVDTLVFILAGPLQNVPMNVLYDHQSKQYLIEQYAIALTPGLELLDPRPLERGNLNILAAGVSQALEIKEEEEDFAELPNVETELQQIESIWSDGEILLNQAFTQAQLNEKMASNNFAILHIATHGQFSSDPNQTFILTYESLIKGEEFRDLIYTNVDQRRDAIELLVLSACQSAVGDKRAALGLAGIAVGAGARSTLATLWQVSDLSTANLMTQFYQTLANQPELSKAKALQLSQLSLLNQSRFQDPYYWAPFVLVGNWL